MQSAFFVLLLQRESTAPCVRREPCSLKALTGSREECSKGLCGERGKAGGRNMPFSSNVLFLRLIFHFSHFLPCLFSHASSPCLVSFHLLFPDLPVIIWLSLPLHHVWILSIMATYSPSSPAPRRVVLFLPRYSATVQWSSVIQKMRGKT